MNFKFFRGITQDRIGEGSSVTVNVNERILRAIWSPELVQDVSVFHNIDAEAELTALLTEQIASEIDRECNVVNLLS